MADINLQLLSETRKKIEVHARGENIYFKASIVLVAVIAGLYLGARLYRASVVSNIQSVDGDLSALEQKRDKTTEDKLLSLNKKLSVVMPLVASHFYWTDGLARIEKLIQPQVQFKSLSAGVSDKRVNFKAEAANYSVVARQIAAFLGDPAFTNVSVGKVLSLSTGRIEFSIQLDFDSNKLLIRAQ